MEIVVIPKSADKYIHTTYVHVQYIHVELTILVVFWLILGL